MTWQEQLADALSRDVVQAVEAWRRLDDVQHATVRTAFPTMAARLTTLDAAYRPDVPDGALHRSLVGMAECPWCRTLVYLGEAEQQRRLEEIRVDEQPDPVAMVLPRWWACVHMGQIRRYAWGWTDTPHRWETDGPIEIRPVLSLHVDVVGRAR